MGIHKINPNQIAALLKAGLLDKWECDFDSIHVAARMDHSFDSFAANTH